MLIKNGFLIDPASDTERLVDLRITDGLIQTLADAGTLTPDLLIKKISIPDLLQLLPVDLLP